MTAAEQRRARMQVRVYRSLQAHQEGDRAFWAALPVALRVSQVWTLGEEPWRARGRVSG